MKQLEAVGLGEVEGDGPLGTIGTEVIGGHLLAEERRAPGAGVVALAGALDLDDVGPEVGEELAAERAGQNAGGGEDAEAGEGGRQRDGERGTREERRKAEAG